MLWATHDSVWSCALDGGPATQLAVEPSRDIWTIDVSGDTVYYGTAGTAGALRRIMLPNGAPELVVEYDPRTGDGPFDLVIDDGYVYWIDGRIVHRPL